LIHDRWMRIIPIRESVIKKINIGKNPRFIFKNN